MTTNDDMREAVARAIYADDTKGRPYESDWDKCSVDLRGRYYAEAAAATARVAELEAQVARLKFYLIEQLWTQWQVAGDRGRMTDSQMLQWIYEDMDVEPGYEHVLSDLGEES